MLNFKVLKFKKIAVLLINLMVVCCFSQENNEKQEVKVKQVFKKVDYYLVDKQDPQKATLYLQKLINTDDFDATLYESEILYRKAIIEIQKREYTKAINFLNKAIVGFENNNDVNNVGKCEKNIGLCYDSLNDRGKALKYFLSAEKKLATKDLPSLYSNLAGLYASLNDNKTALVFGFKGYNLLLKNKSKNELPLIECNNILGNIYYNDKKYDNAFKFFNNSLVLSKKNKLPYYEAIAKVNIATVETRINRGSSAIDRYLEARELLKKEKYYDNDIASLNFNIAESYLKLKNFVSAEKYATECYNYCLKNKDNNLKSNIELTFGKIYYLKGDVNKAISYFDKALQSSTKFNFDEITSEAYLQLSKIYEKKNGGNLAFDYFKKHTEVKDKIVKKEQLDNTEELEIRFDVSHYKQNIKVKNQEIELLKFKSYQTRYQYGIMLFLIAGLAFFVYRQYKIIQISKRNEIYKAEIAILKEEALNKEVEFKNKQVTDFALQIQEQNKLLSDFKQKLTAIRSSVKDVEDVEKIKKLQLQINDSIVLNNDKVQLNTEIKNSQESFLFNLRNKFPELNEKEIQISTYLRLNFNTKQIANQLNIGEQSVNNYRASIRKKLSILKEINLNEFLKNI